MAAVLQHPGHVSRPQRDLNDGLVHAAFLGDLSLVQWFLSKGSQVEYWQDPADDDCNMEQHTFKSSALLVACQQGHLEVVICLHKATNKSNPKAQHPEGLCSYWAILVETLKNRNRIMGRCTAQDDEGQSIHLDVDPFLHPFSFLENLPLLKYLIDHGVDLSVRGRSGKTPLMKAAGSPRYALALEMLLQAGADPNTVSRQHHSALVCAARNRNIRAMRQLLEYGACLEQLTQEYKLTDTDGSVKVIGTACHALVYCVALGYLPETQLLVRWGALPALIPRFLLYVLNLLDQSDLNRYTDCISYLHLAFYRCQPHIIAYLTEINFITWHDLYALHRDRDLMRHLVFQQEQEEEEEEESERDRADVDWNMNHRNSFENEDGESFRTSTSSTELPALTALSMFTEFSRQLPSLFSLCIVHVRSVYKTDSWVQGSKEISQLQISLGLPKPLIKTILYGNI